MGAALNNLLGSHTPDGHNLWFDLKEEFGRLNIETSRGVLKSYQSRNNPGDANPGAKMPALAVR